MMILILILIGLSTGVQSGQNQQAGNGSSNTTMQQQQILQHQQQLQQQQQLQHLQQHQMQQQQLHQQVFKECHYNQNLKNLLFFRQIVTKFSIKSTLFPN